MRRRLIVLTAATTSLVLVAFIIPLALLIRSVAADRAVSAATREAQSAASLVGNVPEQTLTIVLEQLSGDPEQDYPLTIFLPGGKVLGAGAPRSDAVQLAARDSRSITADAPHGREVLVATRGLSQGTAVVRAFVSDQKLHSGVRRAWIALGLLGLVLLVIGVLVADRMAHSLLRSVAALSDTAHRLAGGDLQARAQVAGPPDLAEVATGLNRLGGRIGELLVAEREHAADLSHRLRTPLTWLRLEAESVTDRDERSRVTDAVTALERDVDLIITEARRPVREGVHAGCDATAVVRARIEFWMPLAQEEHRQVRVLLPPAPIAVRAAEPDLAAAVDALLGNVFAHTPDGTGLSVALEPAPGGGAVLGVGDAGTGFVPGSVDRGTSGRGSTGLGLDIARQTAIASGGRLRVGGSDLGGALVELQLGGPEG